MRNVVMISTRAGPGFHSRGERRLLWELRDSLDIIWAALRTLRIGGHSSIGSPDSRTVGSEPGSSRGLSRITTQSDSRRHRRFQDRSELQTGFSARKSGCISVLSRNQPQPNGVDQRVDHVRGAPGTLGSDLRTGRIVTIMSRFWQTGNCAGRGEVCLLPA